jgi:hypothetical protein
VFAFDQLARDEGTSRETTITLSPGFRGGWNVGDRQIVAGFALPISWSEATRSTGGFVYFSYELPFRK